VPKQRWVELSRQAADGGSFQTTESAESLDKELVSSRFCDLRLGRRFRRLVRQLANKLGQSIPLAYQDWTNTKAAYRFLSNPRVNEEAILAGHFQATRERVKAASGPILVLHDTTQFTYARETAEAIGVLHKSFIGSGKDGRPRQHTVCGILMHSSLAVTAEGLLLGLTAVKFWTRSEFKGTNALKRKVNPTRVPIEAKESIRWLENLKQSTDLLGDPSRCVHVGDRESDIYELFCSAEESGTNLLLRTCVDRLADDGKHTIAAAMRRTKVKAITNLPVRSRKEAVEKLTWYAMRWRIETFHKILKSGCRAEASRLRTAERIVNLIAVFCILSWRIFWMTMMNRVAPEASPLVALTPLETRLLDELLRDHTNKRCCRRTLSVYLTKIARLGGYLARAKDPPPGNTVMWAACHGLPTSNWGSSWVLDLWVIENR